MESNIPVTVTAITTVLRPGPLLIGLVVLTLASGPAYAQDPSLPDYSDLPDWSGVWAMVGGTIFDQGTVEGGTRSLAPGVRERPPYNEEWEALYQEHLALRDAGRLPDTVTTCGTPAGWPRIFNVPDPYEFVVRPEQTWVLTENGPNILRIYTDGREHPAPEARWPTYTGDSVGHWEGDTLVFTTLGTKGWMDEDVLLDRTGLVLSNQAEAIQRMYLNEEGMMQVDMVISDTEALTRPWSVTHRFRKMPPGTRVYDYACAENQRNLVDAETGETLILDAEGQPFPDQ